MTTLDTRPQVAVLCRNVHAVRDALVTGAPIDTSDVFWPNVHDLALAVLTGDDLTEFVVRHGGTPLTAWRPDVDDTPLTRTPDETYDPHWHDPLCGKRCCVDPREWA